MKNKVINIILVIIALSLGIFGIWYVFDKPNVEEEFQVEDILEDESGKYSKSLRVDMQNGEGKFALVVKDKDDNPIQGYIFYLVDENRKIVCQLGTDENGIAGAIGLPLKEYTVIEAFSPENYSYGGDETTFTLSPEKSKIAYKYTRHKEE